MIEHIFDASLRPTPLHLLLHSVSCIISRAELVVISQALSKDGWMGDWMDDLSDKL